MRLSSQQRFLLFALGLCQEHFREEFRGKPLGVSFSKSAFIELALGTGISSIKERALYKNLEWFEKKKLLVYSHKSLSLTARGWSLFEKLCKEVKPFISIAETFKAQNLLKFSKKAKTVLFVGS